MGGLHYFWIVGAVLVSVLIGFTLEAHERARDQVKSSLGFLEKVYRQIVLSLNMALEVIEPYNVGHCERVA